MSKKKDIKKNREFIDVIIDHIIPEDNEYVECVLEDDGRFYKESNKYKAKQSPIELLNILAKAKQSDNEKKDKIYQENKRLDLYLKQVINNEYSVDISNKIRKNKYGVDFLNKEIKNLKEEIDNIYELLDDVREKIKKKENKK